MKNTTFTVHPIEQMNPMLVKILAEQAELISRNYAYGLDKYVLIHVKPRPSWMPRWLWYWLVSWMLVRTEFCTPNPMNFILDKRPEISNDV